MFESVNISLTTNKDLPAFDYTKLTAINTCPRFGLIRYDQHMRMPGEGRSTALEMGSTAHEGFAAVRLFQLLEYGPSVYGSSFDSSLVNRAGVTQFGLERWKRFAELFGSAEDVRQRVNACVIHIINSSGYYDDPNDRRRTLSNLETSMIAYVDRQELESEPPFYDYEKQFIGVEVPFDVTIEFKSEWFNQVVRYIGRVDGVHLNRRRNSIEVHENKTASRLDSAWHDSFIMSHQVTGYCVAASEIIGTPVRDCMVHGLMVPLPKTYDLGGVARNPVSRDEGRIQEWLKWFYSTVELWSKHKDKPLDAPEYTHSCNRYFRSCSFIPLCAMTGEDREEQYSMMEKDEWSPLHERNAE